MKKEKFVSLIILSSSWIVSFSTYCADIPKLDMSQMILARAFSMLDSSFKDTPGTEVVVANMPRIRNQYQFPACTYVAATYMAQKFYCKAKKIENCESLSPENEISPFSLSAYRGVTLVDCGDESNRIKNPDQFIEECGVEGTEIKVGASFKKLRLFSGGSALEILSKARGPFSFKNEACYQADKIFNKYGKTISEIEEFESRIKAFYYKNKGKTEACEECLKQAQEYLMTTDINSQNLTLAFQEKTFQKFLHKLVFRDCKDISIIKSPILETYPSAFTENRANITNDEIYDKLKSVLAKENPVLVDGVCVARNKNTSKCEGEHSLVISGFKEACNPTKQCRKLFKIHNSWGEEWQKTYKGGWVDAETFLSEIEQPLPANIFSWYRFFGTGK